MHIHNTNIVIIIILHCTDFIFHNLCTSSSLFFLYVCVVCATSPSSSSSSSSLMDLFSPARSATYIIFLLLSLVYTYISILHTLTPSENWQEASNPNAVCCVWCDICAICMHIAHITYNAYTALHKGLLFGFDNQVQMRQHVGSGDCNSDRVAEPSPLTTTATTQPSRWHHGAWRTNAKHEPQCFGYRNQSCRSTGSDFRDIFFVALLFSFSFCVIFAICVRTR